MTLFANKIGAYSAGNPLFIDDFNYVVTNDSDDAVANRAAFVAAGWDAGDRGCRGINLGDNVDVRGNMFTSLVTSIPGFTGTNPSDSPYAMCMNSLAGTYDDQTDMYLGMTDAGNYEMLPGDLWMKFIIYIARSGSQVTETHVREKFIYPSAGDYPSSTNKWLLELRQDNETPAAVSQQESGAYYLALRDATVGTMDDGTIGQAEFGQTDTSVYLAPNRFQEVLLHIDTSTTSGQFEAWITPQGGSTTKVCDWQNGVDDCVWTIPAPNAGGHDRFKLGTTFPANYSSDPSYPGSANAWLHMKEFSFADAEADLPTY